MWITRGYVILSPYMERKQDWSGECQGFSCRVPAHPNINTDDIHWPKLQLEIEQHRSSAHIYHTPQHYYWWNIHNTYGALEILPDIERVTSRVCMSHVTHVNVSCHAFEWVMSHTLLRHVTHITELCHTYACVIHMTESCHTYEWSMSHTNEQCHAW